MRATERNRVASLNLLSTLLLMLPGIQLVFRSASTHCQVILSFLSSNPRKSCFPQGCTQSAHFPACIDWRLQDLVLGVTELHEVAQAYCSSLSKSLWMVSLPSSLLTMLHLGVVGKLTERALHSTVHVANKSMNSASPSPNTCRMLPVTGICLNTSNSVTRMLCGTTLCALHKFR